MKATAHRRAVLILVGTAMVWFAGAAPTPAGAQTRRVDDAWMGRTAAHQLAQAVKESPADTQALQEQLQAVMLARLAKLLREAGREPQAQQVLRSIGAGD